MRKWWAIGIVITVFSIAALAFFLFPRTAADSVTMDEAAQSIEQLYGGAIEKATETEGFYQIEFKREDGTYLATINRADGQVESLELLEKTGPAKVLSEEQASEAARAAEPGEIKETQYIESDNLYEVEIHSETERKILFISAETGEVMDVQTEALETSAEPEPDSAPAQQEPKRIISQDAAIAIAKETLDGTVDEVEFVQTTDGGYYLVEMDDDASDREVTIQIHAIRGETMTVEWDD
ncbi:PepSY domain-containing protein [Planococcus sp. CP5-4]|uniref:PepSY domain-containing protein n=1 Tax=unclassified Planococcus (in: firmicutes) TaxID=2662419 RepID=UPI001C243B14|nr:MULTISPECIES: PepSY domain-containing protein [unclassified Planococcus (in: firmicutes)]MBU9672242.1 PepSY domain-containing protein [Planococcus sp. CP5-4_YE]MBV0907805.1 PepSY domain-containing protein [Planococcus sp. CP5-4_UN]MBW6062972.1 PepSY domain-containing protein [Planococcus sp. CP5-4]